MSKSSLIVAILWVALCIISFGLWVSFAATEAYDIYLYYSSTLEFATASVAAFFCYHNLRFFSPQDPIRKAWLFLSRGLSFWSLGALLNLLYPLTHESIKSPFPWYSDFGYLMFIPFVLAALMVLRMSANVAAPFWAWIVAFVMAMVISGIVLVINAETLKEIGIAAFMATMAYVVVNPMLLAMIIVTASVLIGHPICRPWWVALTGLFLFSIGNFLHVLFHNLGQQPEVLLDLTWPVSFGMIAVAATMTCSIYRKT